MSQTDVSRMFVGHDQVDVATLVADGLTYRCYVYLNRAQWRIEALCTRVQLDGYEEQIFHNVVEAATATEIDDTNGIPLDSPKIIAHGTIFVVHWLQATQVSEESGLREFALWRAAMDMESFSSSTWDVQTSVAVHTDGLYDVCPVIGSTDYCVVRKHDGTQIRIARYDGVAWTDVVWVVDQAVVPPNTVLSIYAHEGDNDVIVSYQGAGGSANQLFSAHLDADDGGSWATVRTFNDLPAAWFLQCKHCRVGTREVAVVVECLLNSNVTAGGSFPNLGWIHHLAYRQINSATAARQGNEHWAAHFYMCSEPWTFPNGNTSDTYVMAAFRGIEDPYEWSQAYLFCLNLDEPHWGAVDSHSVSASSSLHPRPIATFWTDGIPDARASGWSPAPGGLHTGGPTKRQNHVSHVVRGIDGGPDRKTRIVASVAFAKLGDLAAQDPYTSAEVATKQPERAGLCRRMVYHEDPWIVWRDDPSEDAVEQPFDNFAGANPRCMLQSVSAGRGLVVGGGTPHVYDGAQHVELGFPWKPEILTYAGGTDGDLTANGVYRWYAVYSWTDAAGQTHRSGPSTIRPTGFGLGMGNDSAQLRVRTMTCSLKDADAHYRMAQSIQIELYRTISGGTEFFRVFGSAEGISFRPRDTPANSPLADWITINDNVSDAAIASQGPGPYQLDANGVFVEPLPITPPAMSVIAMHANRAWGADSCDPALLWYSDEILPDLGAIGYQVPVFGQAQFFRLGELGEITAMHSMNDVLVIFTERAIYGLRSADAGSGLLSNTLETLDSNIGCIEPRSVVEAPDGLFFQSAKGICLLTRGRTVDYLNSGAAVEDDIRLAGNVRRATVHRDRSQVRFACNGRPLVTQTYTFTVIGAQPGPWSINGLAIPVAYTALLGDDNETIAARLAFVVQNAIATTLSHQVVSCSVNGDEITLVLVVDLELTLTTSATGGAIGYTYEFSIETRPWVLVYDWNVRKWSRADLVQTSTSPRLSEVVDAAAWGGIGDADAHAVLLQDGLIIERSSGDALQWSDQTSTGTVGIPIDITTAWIHFAGINGYKRIRSIGVETIRVDDEAIAVTLEYDRSGSHTGLEIEPSEYEWDEPAPPYLRIRPRVQKVNAVRLRIYESPTVGITENVRVVALTFDVGIKPGLRRVADGQIGQAA